MKLVYVAGPYRAKTKFGIVLNILRARKIAKELWKAGFAVICPHSNSGLLGGVPEEIFMIGDIEMLAMCEMIVMCPNWERSTESIAELAFAEENGIEVLYWESDIQEIAARSQSVYEKKWEVHGQWMLEKLRQLKVE